MPTILTKKKDTAGAPASGDLTNSAGGAELAVNTFDKRLYTKDSGGNIVEVGTNPTILDIDNIRIDGNTISSTNTNGNINLTPNGTGSVVISKLNVTGDITFDGNVTVGNASTDTLTITGTTVTTPNGLNFDSNTLVIDATNNRVGMGTASPAYVLDATRGNIAGIQPVARFSVSGNGGAGRGASILIGSGSTGGSSVDVAQIVGYQLTTSATANNAALGFQVADSSGTLTERMYINNAGNVGIGTASPASQLEVRSSSDVQIKAVKTGTAQLNIGADSLAYLYSDSAMSFRVGGSGNGTERMRIDTSGNVGIDTSSPNFKLSFGQATALKQTLAYLQPQNVAGADNEQRISNGNVASIYSSVVLGFNNLGAGIADASYVAFRTFQGANNVIQSSGEYGVERARITSAGVLAIGTASPSATRLQAVGTSTTAVALIQNTDSFAGGTNFTEPHLRINSGNDTTGNVTRLAISVGSGAQVYLDALMESGVNVYSSLLFRTRGADSVAERMRITSAGNVGIGTSSPISKLHTSSSGLGDGGGIKIQNAGAGGTTFSIWPTANINGEGAGKLVISGPSGNVMTFDSNGNVGVGTTNPNNYTNYKVISVNGTTGGVYELFTSGTLIGQFYNEAATVRLRTIGSTPLLFDTGTVERMRISAAGDVGIGTTGGLNYSAKFKVLAGSNQYAAEFYGSGTNNDCRIVLANDASSCALGTSGGSLLFFAAGATTERMRLNSSGWLGIGESSVGSVLDVVTGNSVAGDNGSMFTIKAATGNTVLKLNMGTSSTNDYSWIQSTKPGDNIKPLNLNPSGGAVGIGTTSTYTNTRLNVSGDINATRFRSYYFTETRTGNTTFYFYGNASQGQGNFNYANFGTGDILELSISTTGAANEAGCVWTGWTDGDNAWRTMSSFSQGELGSFSFSTGVNGGSGWVAITWNAFAPANSCSFFISIRRINRNSN
jgi:hypothetical protein